MKKLLARKPILFRSKMYEAGEELPAADAGMVEAWIRAGSAAWEEIADDADDADDGEGNPEGDGKENDGEDNPDGADDGGDSGHGKNQAPETGQTAHGFGRKKH